MDSNIYKKLSEFEKPEIVKDEAGYNYKYAGLDQIQNKLKEPLKKAGLFYYHRTDGGKVVTRVYCVDNPESFIESSIEIGECRSESVTTSGIYLDKEKTKKDGEKSITEFASHDPQMTGSAITYYRRYNLLQLFDIELDDDDGKGGSPKAKSAETSGEKKGEPHTCTKCSKVDTHAEVFQGTYGPCFKCHNCNQYSKPNPVKQETKDLSSEPF